MKDKNLHQLLINSKPSRTKGNAAFVERTMRAVQQAVATETFNNVLRTASTPKKESLFMKFKHLPKFAMVAIVIGATIVVSGTAYAAIHWLEPKINITGFEASNDAANNQYAVDVKDCGVLAGGIPVTNGKQIYEVDADAHLSRDQVIDVLKDTCKYQQILQMIGTRWQHDPMPPADIQAGDQFDLIESGEGAINILGDPPLGTVTAKSDTQITLSSTIYESFDGPSVLIPDKDGTIPNTDQYFHYYPQGKKLERTFNLSPNAEVVHDGTTASLKDIQLGDTVYFMTKNHYVVQNDKTWGRPTSQTLVRLIKTNVNPDSIQSGGLGNPNVVGAIAKLEGCQGNGKYLCVAPKSTKLAYDMIYAVSTHWDNPADSKRFAGNEKYIRTDIKDYETGNAFHAIEGHIASIDGNKLTLISRGTVDTFTVELPYNAIKVYNDTHNQHIAVGDAIQVYYLQKPDEDHRTIKPGDITGMSLLQRRNADGKLIKY